MSQELLEVLKGSTPAEARQRLSLSVRDLDAQVLQLTASINGQDDSPEGQAIFSYVQERSCEDSIEAQRASRPLIYPSELMELREWTRRRYMPMVGPITPELMEWARRTFDREQFLAGLREIEATGGVEITDLLQELDEEVSPRE